MLTPKIDYVLLGEALARYEDSGYKYVEVPWIVPRDAIRATLPSPIPFIEAVLHQDDDDDMSHTSYRSLGGLVGSAEQGFLAMGLPQGRYCGVTPCFRHEQHVGLFYQTGFMKIELFDNREDADYMSLAQDAMNVLARFTGEKMVLEATPEGVDLMMGGVEIGSYGKRHVEGLVPWAYGTGLALPRFSVAKAVSKVV